MAYLRGDGVGQGMALGTAAVVRERNGFPLVPSIPERVMEQLSKRKLEETPDVVLVADEYHIALAVAESLRWGRVVGIAAGSPEVKAAISAYPSVVNVVGLMDTLQENMLVLVDAERGVVITDPDGMAVAQYQAEHDRLAPKRRLFLDDAHLPSETIDGRTLLVLASVENEDEVETALEQGADIVYVPSHVSLLPDESEDASLRQLLLKLISLTSGKPLLIADEYSLPPMLLLEAGMRADITLALPLMEHLDGLGIAEMAMELNEAEAECLANRARCALPNLAAALDGLDGVPLDDPEAAAVWADRLSARGVTRIVLGWRQGDPTEEEFLALDPLVAATNTAAIPVFVRSDMASFQASSTNRLVHNPEAALRILVGSGASGIIVAPAQVSATKAAIRELNFSECREELSELLREEA